MNEISLRQALAADWDGIAALLQACGLPTAGALDHLEAIIVGEQEGLLIGVAGLEVYGDIALTRSVAVAERLRGQGLGKRLIETLVANAKERRIRRLYLLTTTAQGYFPRFGFQELSRAAAPAQLQASAEFNGACPASAVLMQLELDIGGLCCGGPAKSDASACCARDEQSKAAGQAGCGCMQAGPAKHTSSSTSCCGGR